MTVTKKETFTKSTASKLSNNKETDAAMKVTFSSPGDGLGELSATQTAMTSKKEAIKV